MKQELLLTLLESPPPSSVQFDIGTFLIALAGIAILIMAVLGGIYALRIDFIEREHKREMERTYHAADQNGNYPYIYTPEGSVIMPPPGNSPHAPQIMVVNGVARTVKPEPAPVERTIVINSPYPMQRQGTVNAEVITKELGEDPTPTPKLQAYNFEQQQQLEQQQQEQPIKQLNRWIDEEECRHQLAQAKRKGYTKVKSIQAIVSRHTGKPVTPGSTNREYAKWSQYWDSI